MSASIATVSRTGVRRESGFVLAMSLVFLLLLTLIGITAMNTSSLEEKMASNVKDKTLSLQATDSTLKMLETWLERSSTSRSQIAGRYAETASSTDGFVVIVPRTDPPAWNNPAVIDWKASSGDFIDYPALPWGGATSSPLNDNIFAAQPRYIIELVAPGKECSKAKPNTPRDYNTQNTCNTLNITARGVGGTTAAVTMSQMSYKLKTQ